MPICELILQILPAWSQWGIKVNQTTMKTKLFTLFLAIIATNSLWAKFQYGNLYYEKISSNTAEVVGYLGEPTSVTIPSVVQYNGAQYTVIRIIE